MAIECAVTDVLLLQNTSTISSNLPSSSVDLPSVLLCADEGIVQCWQEEGGGRGGWVKKWAVEVVPLITSSGR